MSLGIHISKHQCKTHRLKANLLLNLTVSLSIHLQNLKIHTLIPVCHKTRPWMFTFLQVMSSKLSITTVRILVHGKFQEIRYFRYADPVPVLDQGCHFDMMSECEKHINWGKDMLSPGGHT